MVISGEWYEPWSPNTKAYEQWVLRMLINSMVADAARKLGISEETINGILDRWIERTVDWTAWEWLGVAVRLICSGWALGK